MPREKYFAKVRVIPERDKDYAVKKKKKYLSVIKYLLSRKLAQRRRRRSNLGNADIFESVIGKEYVLYTVTSFTERVGYIVDAKRGHNQFGSRLKK